MTKYNPLDDALALIGLLVGDEDGLTDEQALEPVEAEGEYELEQLVITLGGIAAGLCLAIADDTGRPGTAVLHRFSSTRSQVEE